MFLCTGNYYRSRFAEMLFNHLAASANLAWEADSRGLALALGAGNVGPIAPIVLAELAACGVRCNGTVRFPLQLQEAELAAADLIVALDEDEHRGYLVESHPGWEGRVEFWHVHDLGMTPAGAALAQIEAEVKSLIARLVCEAEKAVR